MGISILVDWGPKSTCWGPQSNVAIVTKKMSEDSCYLRDSSIYVHGTVATPPPDLCGTRKILLWSPNQIWYLFSVTAIVGEDADIQS